MSENYGLFSDFSGSSGPTSGGSSIGGFGAVVFMVSSEQVRTFDKLTRSIRAVYADHEVAGGKPASEFTGLDLDGVSFSMLFSADLGVNPSAEFDALRAMLESGEAHPLTVGSVAYGNFTLREVGEAVEYTLRGSPTVTRVDVTIKEYAETVPGAGSVALARDMATRGQSGKGGPSPAPGAGAPTQPRVLIPKG